MEYPYKAETNKRTHLINLGGNNIVVEAGTQVIVYGEDGAFGTVCLGGQRSSGSCGPMLRNDYTAVSP